MIVCNHALRLHAYEFADFVNFAQQIADLAIESFPNDAETLKSQHMSGQTLADRLDEQVAKIGEKIDIGEFVRMESECVVAYNHAGNRIGVLVALSAQPSEKVVSAGKDVAMQIAAMNPVAVDKNDVNQDTINRELDIARDVIRQEGKPEEMVEKIAQGKLNKFFKESTLLNQDFVKDSSKTVSAYLGSIEKGLTVTAFKRVALGE
jgi:elongation factor Ts